MMTIRSHDQFNTTIYGLDDRYRGVYNGRRVIFMNPDDMRDAGLQQGQFVDLTSHFQADTRTAAHFQVAPYNIPRRCTATYYPEANPLVHVESVSEISNTPASKSVIITIHPSRDTAEAMRQWRQDTRTVGGRKIGHNFCSSASQRQAQRCRTEAVKKPPIVIRRTAVTRGEPGLLRRRRYCCTQRRPRVADIANTASFAGNSLLTFFLHTPKAAIVLLLEHALDGNGGS